MKIILIISILVMNCYCSVAQPWSRLGQSNIYVLTLTKPLIKELFHKYFTIFRKGNKAIIVQRSFVTDFATLFKDTPISFDSIFENSSYKPRRDALHKYEANFDNFDFEYAIIIENLQRIKTGKRLIWKLTLAGYTTPCFEHVEFLRISEKTKSKRLKYIRSSNEGCEF